MYIEDSIVDKKVLNSTVETINDDYPNEKLKIQTVSLCCEKNHNIPLVEKITTAIELADIVVFDYGGLQAIGLTGLVDHWNRFFIKMITEHCGKDWRCFSALQTFEQPDREELEELGVKFEW